MDQAEALTSRAAVVSGYMSGWKRHAQRLREDCSDGHGKGPEGIYEVPVQRRQSSGEESIAETNRRPPSLKRAASASSGASSFLPIRRPKAIDIQ